MGDLKLWNLLWGLLLTALCEALQCLDNHRPCENNGQCIRSPHGDASCLCRPGYLGDLCQFPDPCQRSPCLNRGICSSVVVDGSAQYSCSCTRGFRGFEGQNCEINIDDCPKHNCGHGGTCIDGVNTYNCQCTPEWTGQFCTEDVDECHLQPNACHNGGTCFNTQGSHTCVCVNGWTGDDCSENIDDCATAVCFHGATCHDRVASFFCECPVGKTGLLCHLEDACVSNPCHEGAICDTNPVNGEAICTCPSGFSGPACNQDVDECSIGANPCEHFGKCVNTEGSFQCQCGNGYTGPRCETDINECLSMPCQNDATCLDRIGEFTCICMPGFAGTYCQIDIDECESNPCVNNGACTDIINGFVCKCPSGFTGAMCHIDIDECASTPCQNGAKCMDRPNGYECKCAEGFEGKVCERNTDDCNPDPCHHGTCSDSIASFTCQCEPGYTGYRCENQINECHSNPCQNSGKCMDLVNKYTCHCLPGTSGVNCEINHDDCASQPCDYGICHDGINRYDCICKPGFTGPQCKFKIDECASSPCQNGGTCIDGEDSFSCLCPEGYHDPLCYSEVDECSSSPCVHGSCHDDVNGYRCDCEAGWTGMNCDIDKDECNSNPCQNGGTCTDLVNGYLCKCKEGFRGQHCQLNINDCASNPCLNKAVCVDGIASYSCQCELPYTGENCENVLVPCSPNPCENGGFCDHTLDYEDFVCTCADGWQGRICQVDVDECASNPCKNRGTCTNTLGSYICTCGPGFAGHDCETDVNDCNPNPCVNGGSCLDGVNSFVCSCLPGFAGAKCADEVDECESSPCRNGGTCTDYVNSYTCSCKAGFSGLHCENNIQDCTESSCFNGGTCIDGINMYTCYCRSGFTGSNCQHDIDECYSQPCLNGGVCVDGLESYRCTCPHGYTGDRCQQVTTDWCSKFPCKNGGQCRVTRQSFTCDCVSGWTGRYCDIPSMSCEVAALQRGVAVTQLCHHGGSCFSAGSTHYCVCPKTYTGSYCETEVDQCASGPCHNGATCRSYIGGYRCECMPGYKGKTCKTEVNECESNPCQNGGTCLDLIGRYICSCPPGTLGVLCEINEDDCGPSPHTNVPKCMNNGTCLDRIGGYTCNCPPGFTGDRCEGDINECLSSPCNVKTTIDCIQLPNDYQCICKPGYTGRHCKSVVNMCDSQPCQNGGRCEVNINTPLSYTCKCQLSYTGRNCERSVRRCQDLGCRRGELCVETALGARCQAQPNSTCASRPCRNGGACRPSRQPPFYHCLCPKGLIGRHCEVPWPHTPPVREAGCSLQECQRRAGDGYCDRECNTHSCQWDGGDCSLSVDNPWKECSFQHCWRYFNNNVCDELCNTHKCLYDNFNCQSQERACNPLYEKYCADHYGDQRCDQGCNNEECGWDGLDCAAGIPEQLAEGTLIVIVLLPPDELLKSGANFLQKLGSILRATLRFKRDSNGQYMIYPYYGTSSHLKKRSMASGRSPRELGQEIIGSKVNLEIDNRLCLQGAGECFPTAESAAAYMGALSAVGNLHFPYPIKDVKSERLTLPSPPMNLLPLMIVAAVILTIILILGVLVARRKREQSLLWFPEGFTLKKDNSNKNRREPVGQDALGMKHISKSMVEGGLISERGLQTEQWLDTECPEAKRLKVEEPTSLSDNEDAVDCRQWTQHHLAAADIRMPPSMALTPPQGEFDSDCMDVNVRGPDGFTPLMLASYCGGGLDTGLAEEEEQEDSSANIISDLIYQGANLCAQTDRTGETALHLAARYARADAAKRLLDAGADANAQDNTGRTPLHAAVAADAQGVFQILIRNRATDLDARMVDGSTALILAARLAVEGMVEELIACHADVNAVDEIGKSALHWAAAVNNVDATLVLLKNGANKDMQDSKEETPLFLAAREGSFEAAKMLLDHFANRDITDHMDRLPRDIAQERMHHDIVQLLDEYNAVRSPQGAGGHSMSPLMCPPNGYLGNLKQTPQGKKARRPSSKNSAPGTSGNLSKELKDVKPKGKKLSLDCQASLLESSVTLSPVDSLDSPRTYVANPTSPVVTTSGILHPATSLSMLATQPVGSILEGPFTVSLARLGDLGELAGQNATAAVLSMGRGPPLPRLSVPQMVAQPGCLLSGGNLGLSMGTFEWRARAGSSQHGLLLPQASHLTMGSMGPQLIGQQSPVKNRAEQPAAPSQAPNGQPRCIPPSVQQGLLRGEVGRRADRCSQGLSPQEAQPSQAGLPPFFKQHGGAPSEDYLPPTSKHGYTAGHDGAPKHYLHLKNEHPYLTPSPESPEQWSSPSPHSMSDWSDSSPSPAIIGHQAQMQHMTEQVTKMQVFA
ncbi:neurogenic locus notch homolog protein 3 isoform X3 [Hemitrygon akajei]|uniref:neurogenic locus notch homolog protein 3 isoform X3 n=1 Tax=Hemitrygon akajei TaxID=2704970 RepID=UPI003BFA0411